ncbi:MAG: hypothetical protein II379_06270, partial [Oscillospiraceae bacterium]|nr:hypothetical protein [Oscillospiraceae bacterium]
IRFACDWRKRLFRTHYTAVNELVVTDVCPEAVPIPRKERFRSRMRGNLPAPVEKMLESKHGMFDSGDYDYCFDGVKGNAAELCDALRRRIRQ